MKFNYAEVDSKYGAQRLETIRAGPRKLRQ